MKCNTGLKWIKRQILQMCHSIMLDGMLFNLIYKKYFEQKYPGYGCDKVYDTLFHDFFFRNSVED